MLQNYNIQLEQYKCGVWGVTHNFCGVDSGPEIKSSQVKLTLIYK